MVEILREIDRNLANLHCALNMLVKPADESTKGELHDILKLNIQDALRKLGIDDWSELETLQGIKCSVTSNCSVRWQFVSLTLHILLLMRQYLKDKYHLFISKSKDKNRAPPDILSVNQQKTIRTCLQFVVSMGLLPSLLPGVGISLAARCTNSHNLKDEDLLLLEKYERLAAVTRGLLLCCEHQTLRNLIITNHLGDMMAALSQISFVPLKKPASPKDGSSSEQSSGDEFVMTPELWDRLQRERSYFKSCYISFIWQVYQPLVIRELLLLHGAAGLKRLQSCSRTNPPAWLKKSCIQLLIHCLMRPRGVSALVRAICDSSHDSGKDWTKLETVVNLITTVHTSNPEQYNKNICTQIMDILLRGENNYTQLQVQVAVKCIEVLYRRDPLLVTHLVADVLMSSLRNCCYLPNKHEEGEESESGTIIVSEEELSSCIINMHRLFVGLNGKEPALPSVLFLAVTPVLFNLYYKICNSVSHLKIQVEDLLMKFLSNLQPDIMGYAFKTFLFGDMTQGMLVMSEKVEFVFGESGGVMAQLRVDDTPSVRPQNSEEAGSCLLHLLKGDKDGTVTTNLFMTLLHVLCGDPKGEEAKKLASDDLLELEPTIAGCKLRHFVAVKLLSVLSESPYVIERINSDPNYLMDYFLYVLERDFKFLVHHNMDVNKGGEVVQNLIMVVMTLGAALNDSIMKGNPIDWKKFEGILEPLKMIRDNVAHQELQMLASQVYNTIVTRGLIRESTVGEEEEKKKPSKNKKREKKKKASGGASAPIVPCEVDDEELNKTVKEYFQDLNPYKQAVLDVCDPLIPVHGHGLVELTRLIKNGDEEATANKNLVFKIFQDDLKSEDSYIYLLAINGLATMANYFPATVIRLLVDEYRDVKGKQGEDATALRLKIGEVLVRISKSLDSNISSYCALLLNTFLCGARDPDAAVRASSLSNLGEVCRAAGFRVGSMTNEILLCVESKVKSDPSEEVRRAAAMVLTMLLCGLGSDTFKVLGDVLLQLYRALKSIYQKEKDDVVKLHVQLALDELSKSTQAFIFPQQKLEKKIYVLDAPPV